MSAISFSKVTKVYRRSHLGRTTLIPGLNNLTLDIREGEIFGLLGLNGAGKTTTMKLVLGLLFPTSGTLNLFGQDPETSEAKKLLGYLPELPYFYSYLTPLEALRFYGSLSQMDPRSLKKRIEEVLVDVGLLVHRSKRVSEFSKGMLQRLGLAQAILHHPKLIILDEPVSGLDPLAIKEIRDLMTQVNQTGTTILLSSHSISEVEKICHRVGILVQGKLTRVLEQQDWSSEQGKLEQIFVETVKSESRQKQT
ncbi:MAG: ABC transporter ATP-binding protein [Elusimicrobia bacterium]|nr:ABC transporter ATP-binding protein [Elusimicrobiota bacterium]